MLNVEEVKKAVADYYVALKLLDRELWIGLFAPDAVTYCPVGDPPNVGHDGLRRFFQVIADQFDAIAVNEEFVFAIEGEAAVKWTCNGIARNGKTVSFGGIDVFHFDDDGKIREIRAYWDPMAMISATGA